MGKREGYEDADRAVMPKEKGAREDRREEVVTHKKMAVRPEKVPGDPNARPAVPSVGGRRSQAEEQDGEDSGGDPL